MYRVRVGHETPEYDYKSKQHTFSETSLYKEKKLKTIKYTVMCYLVIMDVFGL